MSELNKLQTNHFLTKELWLSAKKLLDFQIESKKNNKTYNTLNFHYFDKIKDKTEELSSDDFYESRISNNLFFGLQNEFFFHRYTIPKTGIGLRKYYFFSYPMQQLLYTYGLYFLKITQQFLKDNKKDKIKSFYGGDLKFNEASGELVLNKDSTLYYKHYQSFKQELINYTSSPQNKVFLRLDIQNYFDNISISKLLEFIQDKVKPSDLTAANFDEFTKEQVEFFFKFLSSGTDNIPQSDNNIISNFIGHLYLTFGDHIIEDAINAFDSNYNIVHSYKLIRYVDDIYIAIDFKQETLFDLNPSQDNINGFIYQLLNKIADNFYSKLGLRFNGKAELFKIGTEDEKQRLLDLIKKVSEDYPEPESVKDIAVKDKANRLLGLIDGIKQRDVSQVYKDLDKQESETLKDVYDKAVLSRITSGDFLARLESKFSDFNFDLLRVYPQPLIILICSCPTALNRLKNYLTNKDQLTTFDRGLLVVLLCQSDFNDTELYSKLEANEQLKLIFDFINQLEPIQEITPGYFDLSMAELNTMTTQVSFQEQVRLRAYEENRKHYSVALNHLLNEIQLACCIKESKDIKTYKSPNVDEFLTSKGVSNEVRTKISNLFDRRNNNPVSHSGSDTRFAFAVSETEYYDYKKNVGIALKKIQ